MQLFISPASATRHALSRIRNRPGWTFSVVPRRLKNADGSVDIGFGVILHGDDRLSRGVL